MEWLSRASSGALDAQLHLLLFRFFFRYYSVQRSTIDDVHSILHATDLVLSHTHTRIINAPNCVAHQMRNMECELQRKTNIFVLQTRFAAHSVLATHGHMERRKEKKEKRTNRRAECYLRATAQIFLSRPKEMMWHTLRNCLIYFNTCTARAHMLCALCGVRERCARRGRRRNAMPINPQSCWF